MFRSALSNFVSNITQSSPKLLTEDDKRNLRSTSLFPSIAAETIVEATDNNTREALVPVKYFKDNSPDRQEELNRLDTFDVASLSEDVMHVFKTTEPTHPVEVSDFGGNASAREKEVKLIHNRSVFNNTTYPSTDRPLRSPLPSDVGFDTELDLHPYADATDKAKYTQNVIKAAASRGHLPDAKTFFDYNDIPFHVQRRLTDDEASNFEGSQLIADLRTIQDSAMQGITSNIQIALQNFYATFKEYFPGYDDQAVELFKIFAITFPLFLRNNWYAKEHLAVARTNLSLPLSLVMNMGRLIEERVKACSKIPVTLYTEVEKHALWMFLESKMVETRNLMFEQAQEILKPLIFKCANVWLAEKEKGSDSHSKRIKLARALRKEFIGKNGGLPDLPGTASNPKRHWPIFLDSIEKEDNTEKSAMFMRTELMTLYLTTFYRDENSVAATLCRYFRDYKVNPFVGSIEYNAWARAGSVNGYLQGSFCFALVLHLWRDGDVRHLGKEYLTEYAGQYCMLLDQLALFKAKKRMFGIDSYIDFLQVRLDQHAAVEWARLCQIYGVDSKDTLPA